MAEWAGRQRSTTSSTSNRSSREPQNNALERTVARRRARARARRSTRCWADMRGVRTERYPAAACVLASLALPAVAFLAQPTHCFRHLYGPIVVPLLAVLGLLAGAMQWVWSTNRRANLIWAIAFAVGIQFTVVVPCVSQIESSLRVRQLALASLVFGWAAATGLTFLAFAFLHGSRSLGQWGKRIGGAGLAVAAAVVAAGVTAIYLGIISERETGALATLARLNNPLLLLAGEVLLVVGVARSVVERTATRR